MYAEELLADVQLCILREHVAQRDHLYVRPDCYMPLFGQCCDLPDSSHGVDLQCVSGLYYSLR